MKYMLVLLIAFIGTWGYAQEGTTEEEYKYLTKGYAYQSDMGLDHKKDGYLIQKIYVTENEVQFIGMFHSFSGKTKAYLAIIPQKDNSEIYICIPNNAATENIRRQYLEDKRRLLNTVALQDQFDEAWRSFFFHQSSSGMNWMQDPKSGSSTVPVGTSSGALEKTDLPGAAVAAPIKPEMTSKGVPVKVQNYDVMTDALNKDQELPEVKADEAVGTTPKNQVRINGNIEGELSDRVLLKAPVVKEEYVTTGKIVIKICVDHTGDVTYAKFTQRGSTTFNSQLKSLALDSVHDAQFEPSELNEQCGYVSFDFE